jgi:hypothetical protein
MFRCGQLVNESRPRRSPPRIWPALSQLQEASAAGKIPKALNARFCIRDLYSGMRSFLWTVQSAAYTASHATPGPTDEIATPIAIPTIVAATWREGLSESTSHRNRAAGRPVAIAPIAVATVRSRRQPLVLIGLGSAGSRSRPRCPSSLMTLE